MAIYLKIRIIYVALVDLGTMGDVIVFKSVRFQVSTLIRYVCVSICIHFQQRFQIDAFSENALASVDRALHHSALVPVFNLNDVLFKIRAV